MANAQNTSGHFQPLDYKSIWPGVFILEGNTTTATGFRGTLDMATNLNTLYGQIQPRFSLCFNRSDQIVETTTTGSFEDLLAFRWQPMRFNQGNRADIEMQFHITITPTPTTGVIRVTSSTGSSTVSSVTADGWYTVNVAMNPAKFTAELLVVAINVDAGAARIDAISAGQRQLTAATEVTTVESNGFTPADTTGGGPNTANPQWGADSALSVQMAREIIRSHRHLAKDTVRNVVHQCMPINLDLVAFPSRNNYEAAAAEYELLNEFWYDRRDWVDTLVVYATGFTDGWVAGNPGAPFKIQIAGTSSDDSVLVFAFATDAVSGTAVFTDPWPVDNIDLVLPELEGPFRIQILGKEDPITNNTGQLVALSIFEKRPTF